MRSPIRKPERNVLRKLQSREVSRKGNRTFDRSNAQEKFRGFELCVRALRAPASAAPVPVLPGAWAPYPLIKAAAQLCGLLRRTRRGSSLPCSVAPVWLTARRALCLWVLRLCRNPGWHARHA